MSKLNKQKYISSPNINKYVKDYAKALPKPVAKGDKYVSKININDEIEEPRTIDLFKEMRIRDWLKNIEIGESSLPVNYDKIEIRKPCLPDESIVAETASSCHSSELFSIPQKKIKKKRLSKVSHNKKNAENVKQSNFLPTKPKCIAIQPQSKKQQIKVPLLNLNNIFPVEQKQPNTPLLSSSALVKTSPNSKHFMNKNSIISTIIDSELRSNHFNKTISSIVSTTNNNLPEDDFWDGPFDDEIPVVDINFRFDNIQSDFFDMSE